MNTKIQNTALAPRHLLIILLACCLLGTATNTMARVYSIQKHRLWQSMVTVGNRVTLYRAGTFRRSGRALSGLFFDRLRRDCNKQYVSIIFKLRTRSTRSYATNKHYGQLRVDEHPIHNITFRLSTRAGGPHGYISIIDYDKRHTIIRELRRGRVLRLKLTHTGKAYFLKYSLLGYTAATRRAFYLCTGQRSADPRHPPRPPRPPRRRSDRDYFR